MPKKIEISFDLAIDSLVCLCRASQHAKDEFNATGDKKWQNEYLRLSRLCEEFNRLVNEMEKSVDKYG